MTSQTFAHAAPFFVVLLLVAGGFIISLLIDVVPIDLYMELSQVAGRSGQRGN